MILEGGDREVIVRVGLSVVAVFEKDGCSGVHLSHLTGECLIGDVEIVAYEIWRPKTTETDY